MNTITSESLNQCLEYCESTQLAATNYGSFIRALVYTMKAELPVEIMDNESKTIIKVQLKFFSIACPEGQEGSADSLQIEYAVIGDEALKTLNFEKLRRLDIVQDIKSSPRTFYRYYINQSKKTRYRFTFNRRITKGQ
ncbi:MAG: hypothetical protein K0R93_846 [Anaerosolibacter sp.]|jgi:hypothetical protein|uniref:hypothetical protein n=1 Tax=Anaerosolibacter sp. TaxID=1872527 RepID=UPI0026030919|nr:hypothetical protein [Anaerosolibacter sp.]MDF2545948.1 hypothetical protein [Anaerosolibacter sp.]